MIGKISEKEQVGGFYSILHDAYQPAPKELYEKYNVKRGLRRKDGTGVMAGLTAIGDVKGYVIEDNEKIPCEGRLRYRGINVRDMVKTCQEEKRFGFEETVFLLLSGQLPTAPQLEYFQDYLGSRRNLPNKFMEDMIMSAPSVNIMNKLARSVLALYSYDDNPDDTSLENITRQCIDLIARFPTMVAYAYQAKRHYYDSQSLYVHSPQPGYSTAQNFLHMIRSDNKFEDFEAEILDLSFMIHAEHGGGNNSAFTTRVLSSSGTDTYSAIAAAVGSLKGPKHGGANFKVMGMIEDFKQNVKDINDEGQVSDHIIKILKRQAYDKSGLVYGMGHAIYTLSDPRQVMLKEKARELAEERGMLEEFKLYDIIERRTTDLFSEITGIPKTMCANVDLYSGFVYKMLGIPAELYTPMFAIARVAGWSAHRIEEVTMSEKIIRPAYKSIVSGRDYIPIKDRA